MQKITILTFGKVKDSNLNNLILDLNNRLKRVEIKQLKEIKNSNIEIVKKQEEQLIRENLPEESKVILLSEFGKEYTTQTFSQHIINLNKPIVFIVSGPYGPSKNLLKDFESLSLSQMTFTHNQALYLLVEQLYRAQCIQNNIPYTK